MESLSEPLGVALYPSHVSLPAKRQKENCQIAPPISVASDIRCIEYFLVCLLNARPTSLAERGSTLPSRNVLLRVMVGVASILVALRPSGRATGAGTMRGRLDIAGAATDRPPNVGSGWSSSPKAGACLTCAVFLILSRDLPFFISARIGR